MAGLSRLPLPLGYEGLPPTILGRRGGEQARDESVQDVGSGLLSGLGGLGDVARLLPLVVVVGGAIYAYKTLK